MPVRRVLPLLVALLACTPAASSAAPRAETSPQPGAGAARPVVERGLVYASPDGIALRMDLAHPPRTRPAGAPAMLWVHGGGFHSGDRSRMAAYMRRTAAAGMVSATIDYRLLPHDEVQRLGLESASGTAQEDAESAVRYLRTNARRFGIDPKRIVIGGASAGAITALNVAAHATGTARVQAAISIAGFGPITDLSPGGPPLLMFHGTADRAAPILRARESCRAARADGERCRLVEVPGLGHRALIARHRVISRAILGWLDRRNLL